MRKKKNIVLERVTVEDYAAEGKSLTRKEGKVIFIENAVPGDVVDVRLGKNKKDWAEGYPIKFHSLSAERVTPFCQHFGVCGGCQWQMLPYEKQLKYKQQQVFDNLRRIGKLTDLTVLPIIGAEETRFYRNKLEYTFGTKEFTPERPAVTNHTPIPQAQVPSQVVGFHAKGFFDKIVQVEKCWLQPEPTNQLRNAIRSFAVDRRLSFYDIRAHKGLLRTMQVRICTTGEMMVNIVLGESNKNEIDQVMNFVANAFPQITTLLYTINLKFNDSLSDLQPVTFTGSGYVFEQLENFRFKIGPKSFFQTNSRQAETLYRIARDFAELNGSQVVYD
ncbi:MAG TPA: 23S rRNA (uracil-5-)-methyltransferase RumA, partial [Chitinophagaceae bacterium]|nr:23S rRNA (uracil-5-)-methyltransferase RumA [Chitinophagaceae bacterium]